METVDKIDFYTHIAEAERCIELAEESLHPEYTKYNITQAQAHLIVAELCIDDG